jgi:hypothetical protein
MDGSKPTTREAHETSAVDIYAYQSPDGRVFGAALDPCAGEVPPFSDGTRRAAEQDTSMSAEPLIAIHVAGRMIGQVLEQGVDGYEAFNAEGQSLGLFDSRRKAAKALRREADEVERDVQRDRAGRF